MERSSKYYECVVIGGGMTGFTARWDEVTEQERADEIHAKVDALAKLKSENMHGAWARRPWPRPAHCAWIWPSGA